jgi:hypothetical protein
MDLPTLCQSPLMITNKKQDEAPGHQRWWLLQGTIGQLLYSSGQASTHTRGRWAVGRPVGEIYFAACYLMLKVNPTGMFLQLFSGVQHRDSRKYKWIVE